MKKISTISALLVSLLVVAGCMGSDTDRPSTDDSAIGGEVSTTVALNEVGNAGIAGHKVTSVEVLKEIPESYTLPEWDIIKEAKPADEGFQWLHIKGEVTNNGTETASLDSTNVFVRDAAGNKFSVSTDTTIYVADDKSPVYIDVQPTQTKEWEGYFMVPVASEGLTLVGNDLSFLPEAEVVIDLALPAAAQ